MIKSQSLAVQEKKELPGKEEKTVPARYFVPPTDIYEVEDSLHILMEMPGVEKKDVRIDLENDTLRVEAQIDYAKYEGLEPVYSEYNVGHFARAFTLSSGKIDTDGNPGLRMGSRRLRMVRKLPASLGSLSFSI